MPCVCIRSLAHSWLPLVARNVQNFGFETQSIIFCASRLIELSKRNLCLYFYFYQILVDNIKMFFHDELFPALHWVRVIK